MDKISDILKNIAPSIATAIAGPAGGLAVDWLANKLGVDPRNIPAALESPEIKLQLESLNLEFEKTYAQDRDSARKMQISALQQDDKFAKDFIYWFAIIWSIFSMIYFGMVTFLPLPEHGENFANIILGFLLGTAVAAIFNFFYGSSQGSKDKDKNMGTK